MSTTSSKQAAEIYSENFEGRNDLRDDFYGMTTLKFIFNKRSLPCLNFSRHYILTGCYEHSNSISGSVKYKELLSKLVTMV
jgi:hypothetical protein